MSDDQNGGIMAIPEWLVIVVMGTSQAKYMDVIPMQDREACVYTAKALNTALNGAWDTDKAICVPTKLGGQKLEK